MFLLRFSAYRLTAPMQEQRQYLAMVSYMIHVQSILATCMSPRLLSKFRKIKVSKKNYSQEGSINQGASFFTFVTYFVCGLAGID